MKRFIAVLRAAGCLLMSGCGSWMDGSYVSITPHMSQKDDDGQDVEWISNGEWDKITEAAASLVLNSRI